MDVLITVLNNEDYLDDLLTLMVEKEIVGLGIIESTRVEQTLSAHIPIFAGLFKTVNDMRPFHKIILGLAPGPQNIQLFVKELESIGLDFNNPENGYILSVPVNTYLGEPLREI